MNALQANTDTVANDGVAYASFFVSNFSLLLSILIGLIATFLVLRASKKLGGGLFGLVLKYVGSGMALAIIGSLLSAFNYVNVWFPIASTVCLSCGYIFFVLGANRLLKGIINS